MNKLNKYLWITAMLLLSGNLHARENETYRAFLAKYLHFYYIESPNNISVAYQLDNAMIAQKDTCTQCGNFWTNFHTEEAKGLLRALFRSKNEGGDLKLQRYAYHILQATLDPKPVQIWIYDDLDEPLNKHALEVYEPCVDDEGYVWPCAAGLKEADFEEYGGFMDLGTLHMHNLGATQTKATFLHELVHSQDHIVAQAHASHLYEPTLWLQDEAGKQYDYPVIEAASSWALAYREGVANTFDLLYDPDQAERVFQWYFGDNILLVEALHDKETTGIPEEEWLYHRICKDIIYKGEPPSPKEYDPVIAKYYREYYIQDFSPAFIVRNEMIMALMLSSYIKYVGLEKFERSVMETNLQIKDDEKRDPFKILFNQLSLSANPSIVTLPESSGQGPKPHLLMMAYIDYFTRYRIQTKEEFAQLFGIKYGEIAGTIKHDMFNIFIDLYWDQVKDDIRYIVTLDDTNFDDLEVIAEILDIPVPG